MTEEEFRTGVLADGTRLMQPNEAVEMIALIDCLRAEEGWAVTIHSDNPEFVGPNCVIECEGSWISGLPEPDRWHPAKTFYGDTVIECLRAALAELLVSRS